MSFPRRRSSIWLAEFQVYSVACEIMLRTSIRGPSGDSYGGSARHLASGSPESSLRDTRLLANHCDPAPISKKILCDASKRMTRTAARSSANCTHQSIIRRDKRRKFGSILTCSANRTIGMPLEPASRSTSTTCASVVTLIAADSSNCGRLSASCPPYHTRLH